MYTPRFNQVDERSLLLEAMQAYPFAILFGSSDAGGGAALSATHLPVVVKDEGAHGLIEGHCARANAALLSLAGRNVLAVFAGPHGYVSPSWYSELLSVPTWNYIAIHAYGTLELLHEEADRQRLVEELIQQHEPAYLDQWRAMPPGFQATMLNGIVGLRMAITRVEGKFKLSQNRNAEERRNVYQAHAEGRDDERALARWMARLQLIPAPENENA